MKIEFILGQKVFKKDDGTEVKYYVLNHKLADGSDIDIPLKTAQARLLNLSAHLENK